MSIKHSIASKNRWAGVGVKERSAIMRERSISRWKKISKEDRRKIAMRLVKARAIK